MARTSRIKVTTTLQKQLEDNIKFDEINHYIKKEGIYQTEFFKQWENEVSQEKLISIKLKNIIFDASDNKNLVRLPRKYAIRIKPIVKLLFPDKLIKTSGFFYYPKTGYMGWHTNYTLPNDRVYVTYSTGNSFFRYYDGEKIITDYDDCGFTIRKFSISNRKPYFWHCVGSDCDRFSFGFRLRNGCKLENQEIPVY